MCLGASYESICRLDFSLQFLENKQRRMLDLDASSINMFRVFFFLQFVIDRFGYYFLEILLVYELL